MFVFSGVVFGQKRSVPLVISWLDRSVFPKCVIGEVGSVYSIF